MGLAKQFQILEAGLGGTILEPHVECGASAGTTEFESNDCSVVHYEHDCRQVSLVVEKPSNTYRCQQVPG